MSKEETTPYHPIACSFYDRLQQFATNGKEVEIYYRDEKANQMKTKDSIVDVFTKDKAEFIRLKIGMTIRLDFLISVDYELRSNDTCGIDPNTNPCGDADEY